MKKVLIVIGKLCVGGAERVGRDIGYYADKEKYEIHYLVFGKDRGDYERELIQAGCRIHHMPSPSNGYRRYYKNLIRLLKREQFDVVHSHTMFSSAWVLKAARRCGVPVRIAHSHTIRGPEKRTLVKRMYENAMRIIIRIDSTHYVACGKGTGNWLFGKKYFSKHGILIYNGIKLADYAYHEEARRRIRESHDIAGCFVLGHVGHLAPVKNQSFILKLLPDILERNEKAMLLLLGDGQDREKLLEEAGKLGIKDHVLFTGNVSNVGEYMSAMDVFLFPSLYEGMPLAMVEAQANGLPCVISDAIPDDVHLTDLVRSVSLKADREEWVNAILSAGRNEPEKYEEKIRETGFDTMDMLKKIYALYEG